MNITKQNPQKAEMGTISNIALSLLNFSFRKVLPNVRNFIFLNYLLASELLDLFDDLPVIVVVLFIVPSRN